MQRILRWAWFLFVMGGWCVFAYLAFAVPGGLAIAWAWVVAQPIVLKVLTWLAFLPWVFSLWIWQLGWPQWGRVAVIALTAFGTIVGSRPWRR